MAQTGQYEEIDWSFLTKAYGHDPEFLEEVKSGIEKGKNDLSNQSKPVEED